MSKRSRRKPRLRIETERSQPYVMTPRQERKAITQNQRLRNQANRIFELERQIEKLARGGDGKTISVELSHEVVHVLEELAKTGLYGDGMHDTLRELLYRQVRAEMVWATTARLATGKPQ